MNVDIQLSAQLEAADFAEHDYYDHILSKLQTDMYTDDMRSLIYTYCVSSSENIVGNMLDSVQPVEKWMSSKPRREAIVNPEYNLSSFGASKDNTGGYFAVQPFYIAK
jgi:uncharacterized protein YkwD